MGVCVRVFIGVVRGGSVYRWGGWVGWGVLKWYGRIGRRERRGTKPSYAICYIKENISF